MKQAAKRAAIADKWPLLTNCQPVAARHLLTIVNQKKNDEKDNLDFERNGCMLFFSM
jgi:hypothetical protein